MATLVQLSESTYLNLEIVTALRRYADGLWHVFFQDPAHFLMLTPEETGVLDLYLGKHAEQAIYCAWLGLREAVPPGLQAHSDASSVSFRKTSA